MLIPPTAIPKGQFTLYVAHEAVWSADLSLDLDFAHYTLTYHMTELLYADSYSRDEVIGALERICLERGVFPHAVFTMGTGNMSGATYLTHISDTHSHANAPDRSAVYSTSIHFNNKQIDIEDYI